MEEGTEVAAGVKDWLAGAKLAETQIPVCVRGDLFGDIQELDRQLHELKAKPAVTMADRAAPARLAEQIEALRQQMRDATKIFRLRALGRRGWSVLLSEHPPRPGNDGDARAEVNEDTFYEALVRRSVVDPVLDTDDWVILETLLTGGQFNQLRNAAVGLNKDTVNIPFSSAASEILKGSGRG